jgi:hypothetical protein
MRVRVREPGRQGTGLPAFAGVAVYSMHPGWATTEG